MATDSAGIGGTQGVEVEFFASLREAVGQRVLYIPDSQMQGIACVEDVRGWVIEQVGPERSAQLLAERTRVAVNDEFVDLGKSVHVGDRVAFLPAVTGG